MTFEEAIQAYQKQMQISQHEAKEEVDKIVSKTMEEEKCTREFAENTFIEDMEDSTNEELEALEQKSKINKTSSRGKAEISNEIPKRPRAPRKPNDSKRKLISFLVESMRGFDNNEITIVNPEREIAFDYGGISYSITLTAHRKK